MPCPTTPSDCMILANFKATQAPGGSHVARIQGVRRLTIVDSIWHQPENGRTAFRFHRSVTNPYMANTHIRGRFKADQVGPSDRGPAVVGGTFENVTIYNSVNQLFASQANVRNSGVIRGSRLYTTSRPSFQSGSLTDAGNNEAVRWDGSASFPLPDRTGNTPDMETTGAVR